MRAVLEEIIERYKTVSDDTVKATYAGSGELCAQIEKTGRGDLYLCHDPFMPWAASRNLISEWTTVASLDIVIIVPKGNPKKIKKLQDLGQPGLRLGIGNRTHSSSGQITNHILKQEPWGEKVFANVRMETKGHQQRCNDVAMGLLDASVVWNAVANLFTEKIEIIPIPVDKYDAITSATYGVSRLDHVEVTLGIIKGAEQREATKRFYEFARTEGLKIFKEKSFSPAPTDK